MHPVCSLRPQIPSPHSARHGADDATRWKEGVGYESASAISCARQRAEASGVSELIDILRGFAIFGILLVNMGLFNHTIYEEALGLDEPLRHA